jgi:hypothetical protein
MATAVATLLVFTCADALGQEVGLAVPQARQGYYLSFDSGATVNSNTSTEDEFDTLVGAAFSLRAGEMITDWVGAGLRVGGGFADSDNWSAGFGGLQLEVQLVPVSHLAVHLGVGAGGFSVSSTDPAADDALKGTGGAYYSASVTYDIFPLYDAGSGGFALTPFVRASYLPGDVFEATLVTVGLQTVWWTGLERNKLDLPFDESFSREP